MDKQCFQFAGIKGIQAGMEYYVCMIPLGLLPKLFVFSDDALPADVRAQRSLNKARIPEMRDYILNNPVSYVFSALTASVDTEIEFITPAESLSNKMGLIKIPLTAKFLINDGQHRKAAIEAALKKKSELQYEDIAVVLYEDQGLKRCQQIFSDLNRHAIRPTKSLNILYDSRDDFSVMLCQLIDELPFFHEWVEKERSTISNRSKALFTLSGLFHGTKNLIQGTERKSVDELKTFVKDFWTTVYHYMPDWQDVVEGRLKSATLRQTSICAHTIALLALGNLGNAIYTQEKGWRGLKHLTNVSWKKHNTLWQGTVVVESRISGTRASTKYLSDTLIRTIEEADFNGKSDS